MKNNKVFLAGSFYKKEELLQVKRLLEEYGFIVVSSWLTSFDGIDTEYMPNEHIRQGIITTNEQDISECNIFLTIAEFCGEFHNSMYELGYANALHKTIVHIGERTYLFQFNETAYHGDDIFTWMLAFQQAVYGDDLPNWIKNFQESMKEESR